MPQWRFVQEASHVEDGSALHGGATSNGMIPSPIGSVWFGRTFCNVERNRHGRASELIGERRIPTWDPLGHGESESEEFDAALVDVEAFVVQHVPLSGRLDCQFPFTSTCTSTRTCTSTSTSTRADSESPLSQQAYLA